jgi:hypothetical protein
LASVACMCNTNKTDIYGIKDMAVLMITTNKASSHLDISTSPPCSCLGSKGAKAVTTLIEVGSRLLSAWSHYKAGSNDLRCSNIQVLPWGPQAPERALR